MGKDFKIAVLYDFYGDMLTDKQKEAIELYYNDDFSLAEVSEHTSVTRQGVRDNIKRAEASLIEMEEKLGFIKKSSENDKKIKKIQELTEKIENNVKNRFNKLEVLNCLKEISGICDDFLD